MSTNPSETAWPSKVASLAIGTILVLGGGSSQIVKLLLEKLGEAGLERVSVIDEQQLVLLEACPYIEAHPSLECLSISKYIRAFTAETADRMLWGACVATVDFKIMWKTINPVRHSISLAKVRGDVLKMPIITEGKLLTMCFKNLSGLHLTSPPK